MSLLALGLLAVIASGTHALHLPEMLLGMGLHHRSAMVEQPMTQAAEPIAFAAVEVSTGEIWCSVEAVPPALAVVLIVLATTLLIASSGPSHEHPCSPRRRTKPPPLWGARFRAALQVYRN